jgi:hypothetical protein
MFYRIMNDVHCRIVVCCYRGRVGTDLNVWVEQLSDKNKLCNMCILLGLLY